MRVSIMVYDSGLDPTRERRGKKNMAAYVLAEIEITNPEGYKEYSALVPATISKYGGRFLVRGGNAETLEGDWPKVRRVLLEFPSVEAARRWWDSPEYEKPKAMRQAASKGRLILLEGAAA
jgi:uncharacterized protein (DUF1330 family)